MTTGQRIKIRRKEIGISAEYVAEKLGVSPATIYRYENGDIEKVPGDRLAPIAKILQTTPQALMGWEMPTQILPTNDTPLPSSTIPIDPSKWHQIPILGRISAGLPLYAEEHIEGYTLTDLNGGAEYFALRVQGDSMNAIGINDGYIIIVRRQEEVENGEVAVVMVGDDDATVKRFYSAGDTVTLLPQSTNPIHKPQIYNTKDTSIRILGKVKKVEFSV